MNLKRALSPSFHGSRFAMTVLSAHIRANDYLRPNQSSQPRQRDRHVGRVDAGRSLVKLGRHVLPSRRGSF